MIPLIHQSRFHWMSRAIVWMMVAVLLVGCRREPLPPTVGSSAGQQSPVASLPVIVHLPHQLNLTASPTPPPTPSLPINPFPPSLEDQISALEVHDRFFYGGNAALPEVALTFDDGPNPPYTSQVLAILKQYGLHATFFCVGSQVAAYPDLVLQEAEAGHTIGNHSWSHPFLTLLSTTQIKDEITETSDIIQQVTGIRPTYFRPPYGAINPQVLAQVNQLGLTTFIWSDDSLDWTGSSPTTITNLVLSTVSDGAIILMHDGGGNRSHTVAALPNIINGLLARHFRIVTLDQLVTDMQVKVTTPTTTPTEEPGPTKLRWSTQ
jgi:peptidoglycan-N-acetylglucosamine deacetylase